MISNFSDAEYLMKRPPHPRERFFEQAVFDQNLSQGLLELARLSLELLDLVRGRLTRRVAGEPFLARLQELLDRKSTRLNSSHSQISYAVFCLKKKKQTAHNLLRLNE